MTTFLSNGEREGDKRTKPGGGRSIKYFSFYLAVCGS